MSGRVGPYSLAELQQKVVTGVSATDPWSVSLLALVVPGGTLDAAGALDVYRRGYVVRLTDQLGEIYASVWRVLGDEDFFAVCAAYIQQHHSTSYNLSDYGRSFPSFLGQSIYAQESAFLSELGRFELQVHDLFHAAPHVAVGYSELAALGDVANLRFRFGDAVALFESQWAVYDLYRHRHDVEPPSMDLERSQSVVLSKQDGQVRAYEVATAEFAVLQALHSGSPVEAALGRGLAVDPNLGAERVGALFQLLSRAGLIETIGR